MPKQDTHYPMYQRPVGQLHDNDHVQRLRDYTATLGELLAKPVICLHDIDSHVDLIQKEQVKFWNSQKIKD